MRAALAWFCFAVAAGAFAAIAWLTAGEVGDDQPRHSDWDWWVGMATVRRWLNATRIASAVAIGSFGMAVYRLVSG